MRRAVSAALFAVLLFLPALASAEPALWVARGAQATLYLFGTIHVLPPGTAWKTRKIDNAFAASQDVWLEVTDADDQAAQVALIQHYGIDPSHPLSGKLSKADLDRVDAALKQMGQPGEETVEPLRPWLVAMMLSLVPVQAAGLDPKSGVDVAIKALAQSSGKTLHNLETSEKQIRFFADLPPVREAEFLTSTLDEVAAGPDKLHALLTAWEAGDETGLAKIATEDDAAKVPALYRLMFTDRNAAWAAVFAKVLAGTGTSFAAVGAGHLVGPDSLIAQLRKLGFAVERM